VKHWLFVDNFWHATSRRNLMQMTVVSSTSP